MISLRRKDTEALVWIFDTIDDKIEVLAYGSRVNGNSHDGIDLDLVYRKNAIDKPDIGLLIDLKIKISDSNIPILVEIRDWYMLPESFHIQSEKHIECL